jgi:DNA-binding protein HU-beta
VAARSGVRRAGVNKAEIVARMARDSGLTKADAYRALDALLDNVSKALRKGDKVTLVGFGTFLVHRRRSRTLLNPRTGATMKISARRVPKFVPGKDLRDTVR